MSRETYLAPDEKHLIAPFWQSASESYRFLQALRLPVRTGRVANSLDEHLTEFSLRLGRLPRARFLPVKHPSYMEMPEADATACFGFPPAAGGGTTKRRPTDSTRRS